MNVSADTQDLARRFAEKELDGETPTQEEKEAWDRLEKVVQDETAMKYYRAIPKQLWIAWAGSSKHRVHRDADFAKLPIGPYQLTVNLPDTVKAVHAFIDYLRNQESVPKPKEKPEPQETNGKPTPEQRLLEARASKEELAYLEKTRELVSVRVLQEMLQAAFVRLREAGEQLQRQFGSDAFEVYDEGLTAADEIVRDTLQRILSNVDPGS